MTVRGSERGRVRILEFSPPSNQYNNHIPLGYDCHRHKEHLSCVANKKIKAIVLGSVFALIITVTVHANECKVMKRIEKKERKRKGRIEMKV